jgi:hypothetical protein
LIKIANKQCLESIIIIHFRKAKEQTMIELSQKETLSINGGDVYGDGLEVAGAVALVVGQPEVAAVLAAAGAIWNFYVDYGPSYGCSY